ncbi:hypothetical protein [Erythrobacter crassostreae]|uniref:DUF481 domain-containing protein n=1 Tax=Erythrobacter crassostreae TaxID=2828328 RepID=A0A9X1JMJ7_9SPHN|nr:hypothetical protein [Erythrobacter crassostrea]MBV7258803.1 hypothetical protein [Erythrobacter crassostrea]
MTYWNALNRICAAVISVIAMMSAGLAHAPASAQDKDDWQLDPYARVEFSFISAESTTRDEQLVVDGDAFTLRAQVGVGLEDDNTRFRIEADRIEVLRLGEGRSDSARDRFTARVQQDLNKEWEIEARARHYDDFVTAESSNTDELQGSVALTYEPERTHRFRVRGTWRDRSYDNGLDEDTRGEGPRFDAQYRHRFGRYNYLTFDLRAESINSDDPQRGYERQSASVSYTQPITPDLRVRPAIQFLNTRFDGRLTDTGTQRNDTLFVPEVELLWWPDKWRVEAEAKYIFSDSNEPVREREGYRLTLSVGYVF